MSRLTRDGTAESVSRDQILRRERGQGNIHVPCSADHEQDSQPYPAHPYTCYRYVCDHTVQYIRQLFLQYHLTFFRRDLFVNVMSDEDE